MTTQQQAYINGFVKRAAQYGYSEYEAVNILKAAELKGGQHKLDVDNDGKIEGSDLKKLRQRKQAADSQVAQVQVTPNAPNPADKNSINYKVQEFLLGGAKDPVANAPGAAPVGAGSLGAVAPGAAPVGAGSLGAVAPTPRANKGGLVGGAPRVKSLPSGGAVAPAPVKGNVPLWSNEGIANALRLSSKHMTPASVDRRDRPEAFSGPAAKASANAYDNVFSNP